jgi:hypothetical protein
LGEDAARYMFKKVQKDKKLIIWYYNIANKNFLKIVRLT